VAAIAAAAALASLAAACDGSPASQAGQVGSTTTTTTTQSSASSTSSAQAAHEDAALAFSRCMRSHGVPSFPDPDLQGNVPPFRAGVSKQTSAAAGDACKPLLASGGGGGAGTRGDQQKLAFALNVARCMRAHGFPTYPDPTTSSQGSGTRFEGTGIDTKSPPFQRMETTCEKQERKALGLP
jgi:hypothetical protein